MHWSEAAVVGEKPKGLRSHSATVAGSKIFVFGGSLDSTESNQLYIFDTGKIVI
jgi:hypothetical protein